jgi:hypothetical protein
MTKSVRTSETSVNFNVTTQRYIPKVSKLRTRSHENLKSQLYNSLLSVVCCEISTAF